MDKKDVFDDEKASKSSRQDSSAEVVLSRGGAVAIAKTSGLNNWSKESFILYFCCFTSFLCACAIGYDGTLMTAINIMPFYQAKFNSGTVGKTTGLIFSIYNIGSLVGPWFAGPIADRWGRRASMFCGALTICLGSAVISSSNTRDQLLAGRFILGFGTAFMTSGAPSYIAEIPPVHWRGRMTAFYSLGWFGGSIPAAAICLGSQNIQSDISWRLPLVLQCVPSVFVLFVVFFLPETPRWLLANGREEEAKAFLVRFHGNNDPHNPLVLAEWKEMKESIIQDGSDKRAWDYSEIFKTRNARYRIMLALIMGVFGQFSGNGLGYFNTQIFNVIGYTVHEQFLLNLGNSIVSAIGALIGVLLADRMPRRPVLVWGTFGCAVFLALNGGLSARWAQMPVEMENLAVGRGAAASYFIFYFIYSFTYTPLQGLYPVEVLTTTTRAKGMSLYGVVAGLFSFINLYATPIALEKIQYRYVFIFVGWDIIEAVVWYFTAVETCGRSLEELEEIFDDPYPVKKSEELRKAALSLTFEA
ncbi:general substrate transporter [Pholiota conissans]|uniref:General substrate transporter n=1 Tax=Pholiota conissans TaxID=109636 RepID=A0A9P5YXP0_9AGAR|nr:general substrate transporter [Pholiota conissans]